MTLLCAVTNTAFIPWLEPAYRPVDRAETALQYFPHFFQASLARSAAQQRDIFRLRHKVYCEEMAFEACRDNKLEQDSFDNRALHAAIRHSNKDKLAGTVRLITSASKDELLPIEQHFGHCITNPVLTPHNFDRRHICEISRLAVPAEIRCKQSVMSTGPIASVNTRESQCRSAVAVSLYLVAMLMSLQSKRHHVFVMIEPALARVLKRIGIHFQQIGDVIHFNGKRAPYYIDARTTYDTLQHDYVELGKVLAQQLFNEAAEADTAQDAVTGQLCFSAAG
ncbi:PEP-CTERM/exosortase system-associated acyltransferase [Rheinheimera sp. YQF-2]|uniref:PEP-CTERM/exosortase system-associated acyltransferase n=1 Tax=Rheinheimera lutimaris TaxID=2740584 RepID=A0A7Y5AUD5_9GAMM|nr:PEP-CTERM/exosortase system-associated acyltransferase [Rheinheimera lutimaris]NRQ44613.1 PEP-CTERM/exosortase system-associated acyltransferase [Rheinheimera lutimaris]